MNKALQNFFLHFIYFFFLPGSPWSFALFIHLPICCLIWHQLLLMSLLSYCFLYRSLTSTQRDCFFTCSHALPCEKTQGTVCAPRQTPYVRFNAWPPHEGHIVHSVYSDASVYRSWRERLYGEKCEITLWAVQVNSSGQNSGLSAVLHRASPVRAADRLLGKSQPLLLEMSQLWTGQNTGQNWDALSARQNPYLP